MYKALSRISLLTVPVAPVIFFGWRVGAEVYATTGSLLLAWVAGLLTAIGLEIVGILAGHMALEYFRQRRVVLFLIAAAVMGIYVFIGASELDSTIGETVFYITPLLYILAGLEENLLMFRKEEENASRDELDKWKIQEANKHELKMARIAAKAASEPASELNAKPHSHTKVSHDPNPEAVRTVSGLYECPDCEFSTDKSRAYNSHRRWCKKRKESQE